MSIHMILLLLPLFLPFLSLLVSSKFVSGSFHLTAGDLYTGPEFEITKYSFAIGPGKIQGTFTYEDARTWMTSPALYLFRDESWENYHRALTCEDKVQFAFKAIPIGQPTESHLKLLKRHLDLPAKATLTRNDENHMLKWEFEWEFETTERTRGWFLIAADCALEQFNAQVPPIAFEINLLNPGNTHLPADEFGLPKLYLFTLFVLVVCGGVGSMAFAKQRKTETTTSTTTPLVIRLLFTSFALLCSSLGCELMHLHVYKTNGRGVFALDLLSEWLDGWSQFLVSFVLICLASGWTLIEVEDDAVRKNSVGSLLRHPQHLLQGANALVCVLICVVICTILLQLLNKLRDETFTKFHDYDTPFGRMLVGLHTLLGVLFFLAVKRTLSHKRLQNKQDLVLFLRRLWAFGSLYFLCFPVLVLFAQTMVVHYNRHRVVSGGVLIMQTGCLLSLAWQFMTSSSQYHKLSMLADAGALPGMATVVKLARD